METSGYSVFSLLHEGLMGKKTNSGREQSRKESRLERCQYLGSTAKMGFVQDPCQVSTNPQEAALLQTQHPPPEESGFIASFLTT